MSSPSISPVLGIDFGTSNSGAGYLANGRAQLVEMTPGQTTLPTTFFFDYETRQTLLGEPANQALLDGLDGRFMRALKRVLGAPIMHEPRQILNERVTFVDVIARFLGHIKSQAEAQAGVEFSQVIAGRPVFFHGGNDAREENAEADLRLCYAAAGFTDITFLPEPEAAAIASGTLNHAQEVGLIVDIGGGTSDFSLFRTCDGTIEILANHGVRIGGTDFDRSISIDRVMPLLGKGTELRKAFGAEPTPVPHAIFNDLATWEKIPFLYTAQQRRMVADMARLAHEPEKLARLVRVLEDELGHEIAFAVEKGKIDANGGTHEAQINLTEVAPQLVATLPGTSLGPILAPHARQLATAAQDTLNLAGLRPSDVDRVIYVGGSSLLGMVTGVMQSQFPGAEHSHSEVFTAVIDGLTLAARR